MGAEVAVLSRVRQGAVTFTEKGVASDLWSGSWHPGPETPVPLQDLILCSILLEVNENICEGFLNLICLDTQFYMLFTLPILCTVH